MHDHRTGRSAGRRRQPRERGDITIADDRLTVIAGALRCLASRRDLPEPARQRGVAALGDAYSRLKRWPA